MVEENGKKILFVVREFRLPVNNGGNYRTWNFIRALRDTHELYLFNICRENVDIPFEDTNGIFKHVWNAKSIPSTTRKPAPFIVRLLDVARGIPWGIRNDIQPDIHALMEKVLEEHCFDFILTRYIKQADYLMKHAKAITGKAIVDIDDIETKKQSHQIKLEHNRSLYDVLRKRLNVAVFERYHKKLLRRAFGCILCSQEDKKYVLKKRWSKNVMVIPNVVDVPDHDHKINIEAKTILFLGTLGYMPNIEGLLWFTKKVFPLIKAKDAHVTMNIVGSQPTQEVLDLDQIESVTVHKNVLDIVPFYKNASLVVVPIRIAGGTRIKILEAAVFKRPVVSTTLGAEGLDVIDGKHCMIADTEEDFAHACLNIMSDAHLAESLVKENFMYIKENFTFQFIKERIQSIFTSA